MHLSYRIGSSSIHPNHVFLGVSDEPLNSRLQLGEASEPLASQLRLDVSKKAIVRRCQIRRVGRMLPLLESEAVDVRASEGCRVRPGIVAVQQDALAHDPTPLQ